MIIKNCLSCGKEFRAVQQRQVYCNKECAYSHCHKYRRKKRGEKTFTFERLFPFYHKWAAQFSSKVFDYWELIAGAWLRDKAEYAENTKIASLEIKQKMISYIYTVQGRKGSTKWTKKPIAFSNCEGGENEGDEEKSPILSWAQKPFDGFRKIDAREEIDYIFCSAGLNRAEALSLKLKYCCGYKDWEIPLITGYSFEAFRNALRKIHLYLQPETVFVPPRMNVAKGIEPEDGKSTKRMLASKEVAVEEVGRWKHEKLLEISWNDARKLNAA